MKELYSIFTMQIAKCNRLIKKLKHEEMETMNLKGPHVSCLYYLYQSSTPLTLKELCDVCDEDKAYISRAIDSLEKDGYIECNSRTEKKYKSPLMLTDKGRVVAKETSDKINKIVISAGQGISDSDRQVFYKTLRLISDNLQKMCDKYGE